MPACLLICEGVLSGQSKRYASPMRLLGWKRKLHLLSRFRLSFWLELLKGLVFERRIRLRIEKKVGGEPQPQKPITLKVATGAPPTVLPIKTASVPPNSPRRVRIGPSLGSGRALVQCPKCPSPVRE